MEPLAFEPAHSRNGHFWSDRQKTQLGDAQKRDAILLKTALEGKDFQTARREVEDPSTLNTKGTAQPPKARSSLEETPPSPRQEAFSLELSRLDISYFRAEIRTPQGELHVEAFSFTYEHLAFQSRSQPQPDKKDPLVLALDGVGPKTTGQTGARPFDLARDGTVTLTSFVAGTTAFLALDRNENGRIDSGLELFGDQHGAAQGYEELAKFDGNTDGQINQEDPVFGRLQLLYGDGTTQPLADAGIQSISLRAAPTAGTTSGGDSILQESRALTGDGRSIPTYALGLQRFDLTV